MLLPQESHGQRGWNLNQKIKTKIIVIIVAPLKIPKPVSSKKIRITPVLKVTEEFLKTTFPPMKNGPHRQLQHQFTVPDMPFTTLPYLDKLIIGEYSNSTKSNGNFFFNIQTHFLDAVGPHTGILESINSCTELVIEDVESAPNNRFGQIPLNVGPS